ncbi:MAG TPA: AprI/Inh family metalloprotease inhibitor [Caulobacteraceae bacterium]|nr:AprI/Inh family metalloprotease inhibitor [Caulobacteraceae bacterium]
MKRHAIAILGGVAALALGLGAALAADHEAGVPLTPREAVGGWTVESGGHSICMIRLTANYGARPDSACREALPAGVTGWRATSDGMALVGAEGRVLLPFDRWSNSLFVSLGSSGRDVQLMRGPPDVVPGSSSAGLAPGSRPYD